MEQPKPSVESNDSPTLSNLQRTASGLPYIALQTASPTPIYLTEVYLTDAPAKQETLSIPSLSNSLFSIPIPYTLADAESSINRVLSGAAERPLSALRASDPETGRFIGDVGLSPHGPHSSFVKDSSSAGENCDLGYYLHPDFRGRGIITAAVRALVGWAFKECGVKNVFVRVRQDNPESQKVVARLKEFVRVEKQDGLIDWPEAKGGGQKMLLVWKWKTSSE